MCIEKLINRLKSEQTKYKEQLCTQSPDEILRHAREYSVRESILECLTNDRVEYVLTEEQAKALLDVQSPFEEIYEAFVQYDDRDEIQETIEIIANKKIEEENRRNLNITEFEKKIDAARTRPGYLNAFNLVEEIEAGDYTREKMIQVCNFCAPSFDPNHYDLLDEDILKKMYSEHRDQIRVPYRITGLEHNTDFECDDEIGRYQTIEEAFAVAEALWKDNTKRLHKYVSVSISSLVNGYREYIKFSYMYRSTKDLKKIIMFQQGIYGSVDMSWYIQLFGILAAHNKDFSDTLGKCIPDDTLDYLKELALKSEI